MVRGPSPCCAAFCLCLGNALFNAFPGTVAERDSNFDVDSVIGSLAKKAKAGSSVQNSSTSDIWPPTPGLETVEGKLVISAKPKEGVSRAKGQVASSSPVVCTVKKVSKNNVACLLAHQCDWVPGPSGGARKCIPKDLNSAYFSEEDWAKYPSETKAEGGANDMLTGSVSRDDARGFQDGRVPKDIADWEHAPRPHEVYHDVDNDEELEKSGLPVSDGHGMSDKSGNVSSESAFDEISIGDRVELQEMSEDEFNGRQGTVERGPDENDKYTVELDEKFESENDTVYEEVEVTLDKLKSLMPPRRPAGNNTRFTWSGEGKHQPGLKHRLSGGVPRMWEQGDRVRLVGMQNEAFNNRVGEIIGHTSHNHSRWDVRLDNLHDDEEETIVSCENSNFEPEHGKPIEEKLPGLDTESVSSLDNELSTGNEVGPGINFDEQDEEDIESAARARAEGPYMKYDTLEDALKAKSETKSDDIYVLEDTNNRLDEVIAKLQADKEFRHEWAHVLKERLLRESGANKWTTRSKGPQAKPEDWENPYRHFDKERKDIESELHMEGWNRIKQPVKKPALYEPGHDGEQPFQDHLFASHVWKVGDEARVFDLEMSEFNWKKGRLEEFDENDNLWKVELLEQQGDERVTLDVQPRQLMTEDAYQAKLKAEREANGSNGEEDEFNAAVGGHPHKLDGVQHELEDEEGDEFHGADGRPQPEPTIREENDLFDYEGEDMFEKHRETGTDYNKLFHRIKEYCHKSGRKQSEEDEKEGSENWNEVVVKFWEDKLTFDEFQQVLKDEKKGEAQALFHKADVKRQGYISRSAFKVAMESGKLSEEDFIDDLERATASRNITNKGEAYQNLKVHTGHIQNKHDNAELRRQMAGVWRVGDYAELRRVDDEWELNGEKVQIVKEKPGHHFMVRLLSTGAEMNVPRDNLLPTQGGEELDHGQFYAALKSGHRGRSRDLFGEVDTDKNGRVSREEFQAAVQKGIIREDMFQNGSWSKRKRAPKGKITVEHLKHALGDEHKHKAEKIFKQLDKANTGHVSKEQFNQALHEGTLISKEHFHPQFFQEDGGDSDTDELFDKVRENPAVDEAILIPKYRKISNMGLFKHVARIGKEGHENGNDEIEFEQFKESLAPEHQDQAEELFGQLDVTQNGKISKNEFIVGLQKGILKRTHFKHHKITEEEPEPEEQFAVGDAAFLNNMQDPSQDGVRVTLFGDKDADGQGLPDGMVMVKDMDGNLLQVHYDNLSPKPESSDQIFTRIAGGAPKDQIGFEEFKASLKEEHKHRAKELFGYLDRDMSGGIDSSEMARGLESGLVTEEDFNDKAGEAFRPQATNEDKLYNNLRKRTGGPKGEISKAQFMAALHDRHAFEADELFNKINADRGSSISKKELNQAIEKGLIKRSHFRADILTDSNGTDGLFDAIRGPEDEDEEAPHGELNKKQFVALFHGRHQANARLLFGKMDVDQSGGISRDEFKKAVESGLINRAHMKDEFFEGLSGDEGKRADRNCIWCTGQFGWNPKAQDKPHPGYAHGNLRHDKSRLIVEPMELFRYDNVKNCSDHYEKILYRIMKNLDQDAGNAQAELGGAEEFHSGLKTLSFSLSQWDKDKKLLMDKLKGHYQDDNNKWKEGLEEYKNAQVYEAPYTPIDWGKDLFPHVKPTSSTHPSSTGRSAPQFEKDHEHHEEPKQDVENLGADEVEHFEDDLGSGQKLDGEDQDVLNGVSDDPRDRKHVSKKEVAAERAETPHLHEERGDDSGAEMEDTENVSASEMNHLEDDLASGKKLDDEDKAVLDEEDSEANTPKPLDVVFDTKKGKVEQEFHGSDVGIKFKSGKKPLEVQSVSDEAKQQKVQKGWKVAQVNGENISEMGDEEEEQEDAFNERAGDLSPGMRITFQGSGVKGVLGYNKDLVFDSRPMGISYGIDYKGNNFYIIDVEDKGKAKEIGVPENTAILNINDEDMTSKTPQEVYQIFKRLYTALPVDKKAQASKVEDMDLEPEEEDENNARKISAGEMEDFEKDMASGKKKIDAEDQDVFNRVSKDPRDKAPSSFQRTQDRKEHKGRSVSAAQMDKFENDEANGKKLDMEDIDTLDEIDEDEEDQYPGSKDKKKQASRIKKKKQASRIEDNDLESEEEDDKKATSIGAAEMEDFEKDMAAGKRIDDEDQDVFNRVSKDPKDKAPSSFRHKQDLKDHKGAVSAAQMDKFENDEAKGKKLDMEDIDTLDEIDEDEEEPTPRGRRGRG